MAHLLEDLKPAAAELARLLSMPDGVRTLRLLGYSSDGLRVDSEEAFRRAAAVRAVSASADARARIGVWEPQDGGDNPAFIRRCDLEPIELWSEAESIPPRDPRRKRVVLLGESVARGLFQDPHFNPAHALGRMLSAAGGEDVEVIDLARTDILILPLLDLIRSSLQLHPDVIVVFAGNNWHPAWAFQHSRLPELGLRLRHDRQWASIKALAEASLATHVRRFMNALGSLARESGVPVVFVIPEFNLADWRDTSTPPALLSAGDTARWLAVRHEAGYAVQRGLLEQARALGHRLLDIDGGSTPAGHYVLADACLLGDDQGSARRHLCAARDVSLHWLRGFSPRIYTVVRDTLLDSAPGGGVTLVDLQPRIGEYCSGRLPGRRLFHDYCHLTVEGTRVCMAHAGARVLELLGGPRRPWEDLASTDLSVARDVTAASHVLAAVFNGNRQQSADLVRYHLSEALRHSPCAHRMLALFVDFHVRRAPSIVCDSLEQLLATMRLSNWHLTFGLGRRPEEKGLNLLLVGECKRALSAADPGLPARVEQLVYREHAVASGEVDLLNTAYSRQPPVRQLYRNAMAYYRAFEPISVFDLICDRPAPVTMRLTYRSGQTDAAKQIHVAVNGVPVGAAPVTNRWKSEAFVVPETCLKTGVNEIAVTWPAPDWDHDRWIDEIAGLFEANVAAEISPVFGHIQSFLARAHVRNADARLDGGDARASTSAPHDAAPEEQRV